MRVLVTGATGFTGRHLCTYLAEQCADCDLWGIARHLPGDAAGIACEVADLRDGEAVEEVVRRIFPQVTVHLAGLTHGSESALDAANVQGTRNLLEAHRRHAPGARVLVVSSSAVYGYAGEQPITEDTPLHPVTPYGRSKVAQEACARKFQNSGMDIIIARPFNLTGPGQSGAFVCGSIVRQVCAIRDGQQASVRVHDISSRRDFIDVRDAVRGYWSLLTIGGIPKDGEVPIYNIGSETAVSVGGVITQAEDITEMSIRTEIVSGSAGSAVPVQVSDCSRIHCTTGWRAEIPFAQTIRDMIRAECGKRFSGIWKN
jgi:GDP-4-dehydro-6-deoxy-D-mannose reductase